MGWKATIKMIKKFLLRKGIIKPPFTKYTQLLEIGAWHKGRSIIWLDTFTRNICQTTITDEGLVKIDYFVYSINNDNSVTLFEDITPVDRLTDFNDLIYINCYTEKIELPMIQYFVNRFKLEINTTLSVRNYSRQVITRDSRYRKDKCNYYLNPSIYNGIKSAFRIAMEDYEKLKLNDRKEETCGI